MTMTVWFAITALPRPTLTCCSGFKGIALLISYPSPQPSWPCLPLPSLWLWSKAVSLSDSLQIDVINKFQTEAPLKRVRENMTQHLDVKLVPSSYSAAVASLRTCPSISSAISSAVTSPPVGSEWEYVTMHDLLKRPQESTWHPL